MYLFSIYKKIFSLNSVVKGKKQITRVIIDAYFFERALAFVTSVHPWANSGRWIDQSERALYFGCVIKTVESAQNGLEIIFKCRSSCRHRWGCLSSLFYATACIAILQKWVQCLSKKDGHPTTLLTALKYTYHPRGMMRTTISPGQWQSWTAVSPFCDGKWDRAGCAMLMSPKNGETTVHGRHCPGDMVLRIIIITTTTTIIIIIIIIIISFI